METLIDTPEYTVLRNPENGSRFLYYKDHSVQMLFDGSNGMTAKWGSNMNQDFDYIPAGPEIADIEITKACRGIRQPHGGRHVCTHCYKCCLPSGTYMDLSTFKNILAKLDAPKTLTQIAFGLDAEASADLNPDIWKIFEATREAGITPNTTVADITQETAEKLVKYCGAVAVSCYQTNKDCCYDSVKLLLDEAKKQGKKMAINMHCLLAFETYDFIMESLLQDIKEDPRLQGLNAVVFLSLKQQGRGKNFTKVDQQMFTDLINKCNDMKVSFGMDSCSAPKYLEAIKDDPQKVKLEQLVESCESTRCSIYVNDKGIAYPCSFLEGVVDGTSLVDAESLDNVWHGKVFTEFREASCKCLHECGHCKCRYFDV